MRVKILSKTGFKIVDLNRRKAIHERCLNCSAWSNQEVENCTQADCPLFPFRTGRGKQDAKARKEAIRAYCSSCAHDIALDISECPAKDCPLFPYRQTALDRSVEYPSFVKTDHIQQSLPRRIGGAI